MAQQVKLTIESTEANPPTQGVSERTTANQHNVTMLREMSFDRDAVVQAMEYDPVREAWILPVSKIHGNDRLVRFMHSRLDDVG